MNPGAKPSLGWSPAVRSIIWEAQPLLSPLISVLLLLMEVQWTANQLIAPSPLRKKHPVAP